MKKQTTKIILLFIGFILFITCANAAYLKDIPKILVQPNGDILQCYASGDEFYNYLHDSNGFTIIQNNEGYYMYAMFEGEQIIPSQFIAGTVNPASVGLQPHVTISTAEYQARRAEWFNYDDIPRAKTPGRNHGKLNNLVVFIRFSDEENIATSFQTVDNMFNSQTPGFNSMINYFHTTSYGHLTISSSFYPEPDDNLILSYQDEFPRSYYQPYNATTNPNGYQDWERTEREHLLLRNAIQHIANMVPTDLNIDYDNDGYVDNVCFVVKGNVGNWAVLLWPHRWALYTEHAYIHGKRVWDYNFMLEDESYYFSTSVLSHEMQHTLGYPDLYHYLHGSGPTPVGNWDIMESNPHPPQQSGGYMKWKYGNWLSEPYEIQPGKYTLNSIGSGLGFVSYKIPSEDPMQFFVLEFRNASNLFDLCYPGGTGMLIYRINTNWNGNADYNPSEEIFDEVYIFRYDGNSPTEYGYISQAHFGPVGRIAFDATTNPKPFLTDGTMVTDLSISDIKVNGGKVSFTYNHGTTQFVSVAYLANGGEGIMQPQMFEEDIEQNLRNNTFTFDGYVFEGWALAPDGEIVYENNQSVAITEDIVLYAVWSISPVYYTIRAEVLIPVKCATIEPAGEILVLESTNQTFVIQSFAPCEILEIEVDGEIFSNEGDKYFMEYTFENVSADHYIYAQISGSGINEDENSNDMFSIHPNPATQYFEIILPSFDLISNEIKVQIYDVQGLLLKTLQIYDEKTRIDISYLAKGFYFVKIENEVMKLIVK